MILKEFTSLHINSWDSFLSAWNGLYDEPVHIYIFNPELTNLRESQSGNDEIITDIEFDRLSENLCVCIFKTVSENTITGYGETFEDIFYDFLTESMNLPLVLYGDIEFNDQEIYDSLISRDVINENENLIFAYLLNSDKHTVDKNLIPITVLSGNYTKPVTFRNFNLEITDYLLLPIFNYLYIPKLKRYYYVSEIIQQKDFAILTLKEDVLMSFKDMILSQSAYINRNDGLGDDEMPDNTVVYSNKKRINITEITPLIDIFKVSEQDTVNENLGGYILTTVG